jgi:hypothetical protein
MYLKSLAPAEEIGWSIDTIERMYLTNDSLHLPNETALRLEDNSGGEYFGLVAPIAINTSYTLVVPTDAPTLNGQTLTMSGTTQDGNTLSWSNVALDGGNSLGASLTLGTNDDNNVVIERNTATKITVNTDGVTLADPLTLPNGTVTAPSLNFGDLKSGFYRANQDEIRLVTDGKVSTYWDSTGAIIQNRVGFVNGVAGSATTPAWFYQADTTTGWYRPVANQWSYATSGVESLSIDSSGYLNLKSNGTARRELRFHDDSNTNHVGLRAPSDVTTDYTVALPPSAPSVGATLTASSAGLLEWRDPIYGYMSYAGGAIPVVSNAINLMGSGLTTPAIPTTYDVTNGVNRVAEDGFEILTAGVYSFEFSIGYVSTSNLSSTFRIQVIPSGGSATDVQHGRYITMNQSGLYENGGGSYIATFGALDRIRLVCDTTNGGTADGEITGWCAKIMRLK